MKFHLLDQKAARLPIIGVLSALCLVALMHIANAAIDFEVWQMDRNAPTIETRPAPLPQPWHHGFEVKPAIPETPTSVCDPACQQRQVLFI